MYVTVLVPHAAMVQYTFELLWDLMFMFFFRSPVFLGFKLCLQRFGHHWMRMIKFLATTNLKSAEYTPYKYTTKLDVLAICHLPLILFAGSTMVSVDMELVVLLVVLRVVLLLCAACLQSLPLCVLQTK